MRDRVKTSGHRGVPKSPIVQIREPQTDKEYHTSLPCPALVGAKRMACNARASEGAEFSKQIPLFLANHPKLSFRLGNYGSSNAPSVMTQGVVQNGSSETHWGRLFCRRLRRSTRHPLELQ